MKPRRKYTEGDLQNAIRAINNGSSVYKASRVYNIPETTLRDKRDKKYFGDRPGRKTILTKSEETKIVDWIHCLGKQGFPVSKEQLKQGVAKLVENLDRPNTFKDGMPGKHWLAKFLARHPTVAKRVAQTLPTHRNKITEQDVRNWFDRVKSYFENNNLLGVLEDDSRVYNCDETAFFLCPKEKDVLVKKGSKRVYNRVANDDKECLTVLVNVSAGGKIAPPMILYPYKRLPKNLPPTVPPTWGIGCTESGWMTMEAFYEYITNVFYKWLQENQVAMPVALFMDGHTSHISLPLSLFCKEKGIILVALLPNSTHLLQPLDVGVFRPVKGTWKNVVHDFRVNNNYAKLKRTDFAMQVQKCFEKSLKVETIKNSFRSAGIFPFDYNNIDFSKVIPQKTDNGVINTEESSTEQSFRVEFEKRLAPGVLRLFVESGSEWEGDERYKCLFEFWKKIQQEEPQPPPFFDDTTIVNNIQDCDLSDVVMNMEIGSNGSIILPLTPNLESIMSNDIAQLVSDQPQTPHSKNLRQYSSDSSSVLQRHGTEDEPQPCCSRILNFPSSRRSSRQSSSDQAQDISSPVNNPNLTSMNEKLEVECTPQNFATPFKRAFYFPKSPKKATTRQTKKLTPTVAVADEFIEYQRRVEKEKKEKREGILKRRTERLKKQEENKSQNLLKIKTIQRGKTNLQKSRFTLKKPTILKKIEEDQEAETNILDDDNRQIALPHRKNNAPIVWNFESSNDDEDVTLTIRNKKAYSVKKTLTRLFGESSSDEST